MSYTTTDLISSIVTRGMIPDSSTKSLSTATLLNLATEELHIQLVPLIMSAREHYYETYADQVIVAGQVYYPIPVRALGGVLAAVQYFSSPCITLLPLIDPAQMRTTSTSSSPVGYYLENNNVVLYPTPTSTIGSLRLRYFQRPSRLEQTQNCAQVASILDTQNVTVSSVPGTWTVGNQLDFIQQGIPYRPYALNQPLTVVAGTQLTFAALPSGLAVGDWLALAEFTPIPELPFEFMPVLAQMTVVKALEAMGDQAGLQAAEQKLTGYMKAAIQLITPRSQSHSKKVVSGWRCW